MIEPTQFMIEPIQFTIGPIQFRIAPITFMNGRMQEQCGSIMTVIGREMARSRSIMSMSRPIRA
jgi:hypothetical protein